MASKKLEISLLLDCYGEVLSEKQRLLVEYYYDDDLSLAEIAENEGITRQGVRDTIKRATDKLNHFENELGLCKRLKNQTDKFEKISALADTLINDNNAAVKKTALLIKEICNEED